MFFGVKRKETKTKPSGKLNRLIFEKLLRNCSNDDSISGQKDKKEHTKRAQTTNTIKVSKTKENENTVEMELVMNVPIVIQNGELAIAHDLTAMKIDQRWDKKRNKNKKLLLKEPLSLHRQIANTKEKKTKILLKKEKKQEGMKNEDLINKLLPSFGISKLNAYGDGELTNTRDFIYMDELRANYAPSASYTTELDLYKEENKDDMPLIKNYTMDICKEESEVEKTSISIKEVDIGKCREENNSCKTAYEEGVCLIESKQDVKLNDNVKCVDDKIAYSVDSGDIYTLYSQEDSIVSEDNPLDMQYIVNTSDTLGYVEVPNIKEDSSTDDIYSELDIKGESDDSEDSDEEEHRGIVHYSKVKLGDGYSNNFSTMAALQESESSDSEDSYDYSSEDETEGERTERLAEVVALMDPEVLGRALVTFIQTNTTKDIQLALVDTLVKENAKNKLVKQLTTKNWVQEVHDIREKIVSGEENALKELYELETDFKHAAATYAKIIVSERNLPTELKTIKPTNVGGIAGGEKYIKNGILFKFALDAQLSENLWMYGGKMGPKDEYASKAAGQELKLSQRLSATHTAGLHYPLMAIVDYSGFRIIAMSLLPIGKDTLRYGSNDGGITIRNDVPEINRKIEKACNTLGLATHEVRGVPMAGPGDLEVHEGYDGRHYVLDFARLMPPEAPPDDPVERKKFGRAVFYRMIRPELLWKFKEEFKELVSSDSFTGWARWDSDKTLYEDRLRRIRKWVHEDIIPKFAEEECTPEVSVALRSWVNWRNATRNLYTCDGDTITTDGNQHNTTTTTKMDDNIKGVNWAIENLRDCLRLLRAFQGAGCNLRHLGILRSHIKDVEIKDLLMMICAARVEKNRLKKLMRAHIEQSERVVPSELPTKRMLVRESNLYLGTGKDSTHYWTTTMKEMLSQHYSDIIFTPEELVEGYDFRNSLDKRLWFIYVHQLVGSQLSEDAKAHMWVHEQFTLMLTDMEELKLQVKSGFEAYFAAGNQTMFAAQREKCSATRYRMLTHCRESLEIAERIVPNCPLVASQLARCYHLLLQQPQTELSLHPRQRLRLADSALERFQKVIDQGMNKDDMTPMPLILLNYEQFLLFLCDMKRSLGESTEAKTAEKLAEEVHAQYKVSSMEDCSTNKEQAEHASLCSLIVEQQTIFSKLSSSRDLS